LGEAVTRQWQRRLSIGVAWVAVLMIVCVVSPDVRAQAAPRFELEVIVANLSKQKGGVDKGAKRLHRELQNQFRYESIRVLDSASVVIEADQVWDMKLPTRRRLRIRPLVVEEQSALISVDVSGLVQSDLRIKKGQIVIIGAERYRDGKLVIALEAED